MRKRVYVAGAYSADNVLGVLDNMRRGMVLSKDVFRAGFAPWCPWMDYHYQLLLQEGETLTIQDYYEYSMAWLEVADAVLVVPNSEHSKGTQAEIARALELSIPVFTCLATLKKWDSNQGG